MKSTTAAAILAIASSAAAVVIPVGEDAFFTNETEIEKRETQICVHIGGAPTWYYTFSGVWGTDTGRGPQIATMFCVDANNGPGGAMYIGPNPNPGPGSTKLECFFPTDGQANCDMSLVDGYSLSVNCQASGQTIGGDVNLYTTGIPCPDQEGPNCINHDAYNGGGQGAVNAFFQPAVQNGNNYCIFNNCGQNPHFNSADGISCTVSGGM